MEKKANSKLLHSFVIAGIVLTLLVLIGTPLMLTALFKSSDVGSTVDNIEWVITGCIYACAIPYVIALFKFRKVCILLTSQSSFSPVIPQLFQQIAYCGFAVAVLYVLSNLFLYIVFDFYLYALTIIPLFVISFIAVTAGFFSLVLSNIFKRAAEIQEENDLTF